MGRSYVAIEQGQVVLWPFFPLDQRLLARTLTKSVHFYHFRRDKDGRKIKWR